MPFRSARALAAAIIAALLLLIAAPGSLFAQGDLPPAGEPEKKKKKEPPRPTLEKYLETLEGFLPREHLVEGIAITSTVVPDLETYALARALEEAKKNGWDEDKTAAHMRAEHKKLKRIKEDRILIRLEIQPYSQRDHLFLQKRTKSHFDLDGEGKVAETSDGDPEPRFDKWQIIQGASMKSFTLARFERLVLEVEVRKKSSEVCRLRIVDLLRYHEAPRKSEYETKGINVEARQISLGTIRDMIVDPIEIELAPATWDSPLLPEELEAWRKKLEME